MDAQQFEQSEDQPRARRKWRIPLEAPIFIVLIVAVYAWLGRTAPIPAYFDESLTLDVAMTQASESDRVVFAYATADWCTPCQTYKRGALKDKRVVQWMDENALPVYVDVDENEVDAYRLGVGGLPATFVLSDGKIVASFEGVRDADALLAWLDNAHRTAVAIRNREQSG